MNVNILNSENKVTVFDKIRSELQKHKFSIINEDQTRPWGGFFVIDEKQTSNFVSLFFSTFKA